MSPNAGAGESTIETPARFTRTALLAAIVTISSGAMLLAAAILPGVLCANVFFPPPQQPAFPLPAANGAVAPQNQSGVSGCPPGKGTTEAGTAGSAQEWAERMFPGGLSKDFGAVPFGTRLMHRFGITNIYAAPVEITGLRIGCGCVTATLGKRILQPGESTTIDVAFDTREFTGPNTQTVRVGFGTNPRSSCAIKVSAVSQTDVVFKPDRVSFGTVESGRASVRSTDVEYTGPLDWQIEKVIVAKELPFEAALSELLRQPGKVGYRLTVTLKDDAPIGKIRDYIYLKTNQIDVPPVPVLVTAIVQAPPTH